MYDIIKKFLNDGGKCLLIEDGKPVGIFLSVEEYEKLKNNLPEQKNNQSEFSFPGPKMAPEAKNSIGEAMVREMDFPEASAEIADIEAVDDVTLEDLGINELS